ncbi:DUF1836 domain-containing protein [Eggerthella sinensis]|jgi:hypothetical protein|uniref:DUF1836 domain-containing protein n=1 Tax=Eggerthella sinensis TaxID=242230 RepID=UPI001D068FAA|nr:DUF1836 domain-containing protein [Eggerthella sinensis]MCB7037909.1 DUF1836 domain-containing protein [Eggerthella sinensis]
MNVASVSASSYAERLVALHLPRYDEIPSIDLYMDQLVGYLEEMLAPLYRPDEKIITRSMVNNYVKQGVLASAAGKKYTRSHIAYLIVICTLKQTFSIAEIDRLIRMQIASFDTHVAYDYYCEAFEAALRALFSPGPTSPQGLKSGASEGDFERDLVLASTAAVAYTLYIKASIAVSDAEAR